MESGLGSIASKWDPLAVQLAEYGTVLSYDRGDYGYSQTTNYPRSSETISLELAQLLDETGLSGPVIYIGHSFGASQVLSHAQIIDRPLAGIVMIDPAPPDSDTMWESLLEDSRLSPKARRLIQSTMNQNALFAMQAFGPSGLMYGLYRLQGGGSQDAYYATVMNASSSGYYMALKSEMEFSQTSYTAEELSALPLVLLTNNHEAVRNELVGDYGLSEAEAALIADTLHRGKLEYLSLSANSRLVEAKTGAHDLHLVEPDLVIEAVRSILNEYPSK